MKNWHEYKNQAQWVNDASGGEMLDPRVSIKLTDGQTSYTPTQDFVVIELDKDFALQRKSELVILDKDERHRKDLWTGVVIAVGPGFTDRHGEYHAVEVAVGDRVLFENSRRAVEQVRAERTLIFFRARQILATLHEDTHA